MLRIEFFRSKCVKNELFHDDDDHSVTENVQQILLIDFIVFHIMGSRLIGNTHFPVTPAESHTSF